jgi:hypothetical protein
MKKTLFAALVAMTTSASYAAPHAFQLQIGASELDPGIWQGPVLYFAPVTPGAFTPSVEVLYATHNVDGAGHSDFSGSVEPRGPGRISLYEVYRETSEGVAYQGYYQRFPADTDWEALARDQRQRNEADALVEASLAESEDAS